MQLKTILNRVEHFKSFVYENLRKFSYGKEEWVEAGDASAG